MQRAPIMENECETKIRTLQQKRKEVAMRIDLASSRKEAIDHLERGLAIAVPGPTPFPYVLAGLSAATVNEAKGRPADQPAVLILADLDTISPFLALEEETLSYARWLTSSQSIHLLLPVTGELPEWAKGAVSKEMLGVSMAWHPELLNLLSLRGYLFATSANLTGDTPIGSAAEVDASFASRMLVIETGAERDQTPAVSGMIVKVNNGLKTELVRAGFQHEQAGLSAEEYIAHLPALWRSQTTELVETLD